MDGNHEGH